MLYAQEVEQRRRDVKIVDINLLRRSWYFDYLRHAYPGLIERSRDKIDTFVANLKEWERDPRAFATSETLTQKINTAFEEMIQSMVTNEIRVGPVYITRDFLFTDESGRELSMWIRQNYQLVPQGLVFNLASDQSFRDLPDAPLQKIGRAHVNSSHVRISYAVFCLKKKKKYKYLNVIKQKKKFTIRNRDEQQLHN